MAGSEAILVTKENPHSVEARALMQQSEAEMRARYPGSPLHPFDPQEVAGSDGGFLMVRVNGEAVGCGAIRILAPGVAEVKRMFVAPAFRRRGLARRILSELESLAQQLGYRMIRLETGTRQPEAIALYESADYVRIPRYGEYANDPFSVCFEKHLDATPAAIQSTNQQQLGACAVSNALADRYRRWFDYEKDAHGKVVRSLESVPAERRSSSEFKKAVGLLAHLVAARRIWLTRLGVMPASGGSVFPENAILEDVAKELGAVQERWSTYLSTITDAEIGRTFEYQSLDAGRFRNAIDDILTQLFGHSSYHRGQIAILVRAAGGEPAVTDFVYWCRVAVAT
jgi:uncharacterized damage-inducible protein DinB/GNAT superfamily N-acetyltransferase